MLRRRALLYESIHPGTTFVVGKGAGDHARGEVIGPGHSEVHLLIEGALARGEGFRRLFRKLFGKAHDFRVESIRLHCANSFSIFGRSFSARISFRSWPAQKPFPAPASTTTRIFLSETKESKAV